MTKPSIAFSEPGTFKGYNFSTWFVRNKDTLKMIIMAIVGITAYAANTFLPVWANVGLAGLITGLAKLGVDAVDFYATEVLYVKE